MAILSMTRELMDKIRKDVSPAVVSIWEKDNADGPKLSCRSGFVVDYEDNVCRVVTLAKGLDAQKNRKVFVQFSNGQLLLGSATFQKGSCLAVIVVDGLNFEVQAVTLAKDGAKQCDPVVHVGCFDDRHAKIHFSSGSVGLVDHILGSGDTLLTRFAHSCSEGQHLLGAPVFNMESHLVGVNHSKKNKNVFFAIDLYQFKREMIKLDLVRADSKASCVSRGSKSPEAKKRKLQ